MLDVLEPGDPRPAARAALARWVALQQALALRPQDARRALERSPDPVVALRLARATAPPAAEVAHAVAALARVRAVALPFPGAAYPERLRPLADAAPLLLVRGEREVLAGPCVAVVGSRAATVYGRAVARRFADALARAGCVVVSGLALGIDAVAHEAALAAGGRSVAVMACGPERIYPARHRRLAAQIEAHGALVTEFPPGTPPRPPYFPLRNRLISALSLAVVVVEARERSGSLTTAHHAAEQGVEVFAVPGPIDAPTSFGTNRLLSEGAQVALGPESVLERLAATGLRPAPPSSPAPRLAEGQRRLVALLRRERLGRDALARRLGVPPQQLAGELVELELAGVVAEDRDGRLRVVAAKVGRGL